MEANLCSQVAYPPPVPAFPCIEPEESHQRAAGDINPNVIQIDRREVSRWTLSEARRAFDVFLSLFALILFFPIMCAVALAVRFSSPGPILFQQRRMGKNGRVFILYKFRSMRLASEQFSAITVTGDSRVTWVGKILRKCKLDELPQFWNVLRGDMSIVGPRPKLPHHEGLQMPFRPGITGPATLAFRHEEKLLSEIPREHLDAYYQRFVKPRKAAIDMAYMRNASLKSDLLLLLHTAASCFSSKQIGLQAELPDFEATMLKTHFQPTGTVADSATYA